MIDNVARMLLFAFLFVSRGVEIKSMIGIKKVNRKFQPDCSRVIVKPHIPNNERHIIGIMNRVLNMSDTQVEHILEKVLAKFSGRHKNIFERIECNYNKIKKFIPAGVQLEGNRKVLMGAYFSCEYSIQSAAFFNPSIVPHPNQEGLEEGSLRFILSFRSVGEGHISSVEFRSGVIDKNFDFSFDNVSCYAQSACGVSYLNDSDYLLQFKQNDELSERILFPATLRDCNGIEDARFVRFTDDDGSTTYYATYTAYDGHNILPQIIETKDFIDFKIFSLSGKFSRNKGMALFPRKINGKYAMISRVDGENLYIMFSDDISHWDEAEIIKTPESPWEFVQIGNCGSPIETDKGWILLTHGVGPMREYSIGVVLLDIANPVKIVGNMIEPLLFCDSCEREGYVPNVVYSCGSLVHNENLIIPYAMSDTCSGIATVSLSELFTELKPKELSETYANTT